MKARDNCPFLLTLSIRMAQSLSNPSRPPDLQPGRTVILARGGMADGCLALFGGRVRWTEMPRAEDRGVADHVHALFDLHRTVALSDVVGQIKAESRRMIKPDKRSEILPGRLGVGAFAVSASNLDQVVGLHRPAETSCRRRRFRTNSGRSWSGIEWRTIERYVWD